MKGQQEKRQKKRNQIYKAMRKGLAGILALALTAGSMAATSLTNGSAETTVHAAEASQQAVLLARYPLINDTNDISGNGRNGTRPNGNGITFGTGDAAGMILPGGALNTNNYVTLPGEMFVGRENLTISAWIKNEMGSDNYSALFFGTETQANNFPANYWLFNPCSPQNNFKSVFTESVNKAEPYLTEVGLNDTKTDANQNKWMHYTTVITPNSIRGYIDGRLIGTAQKNRSVSDFGTNLQAYIGRSNYTGDPLLKGTVQDVRIYEGALSEAQIQDVMMDAPAENTRQAAREKTAAPELYLHYDFSKTNGTIVPDSSGNGHDGTIKGNGATVADGILTLPGGNQGSNAAYVEIPSGTFDNQDTLTISLWLKNETGKGNYSAMFFGTTEGLPSGYWLLNPCNLDGRYKSVFTNDKNTSEPFKTEVGISPTTAANGVPGPFTNAEWSLYTTVIEPDRISAYYNGKFIGTKEKTRSVSDFGTNLVSYLGKSSYNDIFYKGGIQDVRVYKSALTAGAVADLYDCGPDAGGLDRYMEELTIEPTILTEDLPLPASLGSGAAEVTWTSSNENILTSEGKVTRPENGTGNQPVTLTAKITYNGYTKEKTFSLTVAEKPYGNILTYVRLGNTDRTDALHIACSNDEGRTYQALYNNEPILYTDLGNERMGSPALFRKPDGSYGMITDNNHLDGQVILYDSADLLTYTNPRIVTIDNSGRKVWNTSCTWLADKGQYIIRYESSDGCSYAVYSSDLKTFTTPVKTIYQRAQVTAETLPEDAAEYAVFDVTKEEYDRILKKYGRVKNTSVAGFDTVTVDAGTDKNSIVRPSETTASYSDGTTKEFGIDWNEADWANVDTSKPGTYTVNGTLRQPDYGDILIEQRADPYVVQASDGSYYFTASYPVCGTDEERRKIGYDRIVLRHADTIEGLADAKEVEIWNQAASSKAFRYIWAPEIHQIGGSWYILFTASTDSNNVWNIRPHMLKCIGNDPMNPDSWKTADGSNLYQVRPQAGDTGMDGRPAFSDFSLDMTYFESNGHHYLVWAEKPGGISKIYMAEINPAEPWQLTSPTMLVSEPDFAWERSGGTIINEGPAILKHDGKIHLCFSAAAVDYTYCVGMLTAEEGTDLLNPASWTKYPTPILKSEDFAAPEFQADGYAEQCGPGHNSYTYDKDGNPVIVYHARPMNCSNAVDADGNFGQCSYVAPGQDALSDPCRHARAKSLNFAADGTPILNMTKTEELQNKTVTFTVVVEEKNVLPTTFYAEKDVQTTLQTEQAERIVSAENGAQCSVAADGSSITFTGTVCGETKVVCQKTDGTQVTLTVQVYDADNRVYVLDYGLPVDLNAPDGTGVSDAFGIYRLAEPDVYGLTGKNLPAQAGTDGAQADAGVAVLKGFRSSGTQDAYTMQVTNGQALLACSGGKLLYTPAAFMSVEDVYEYQAEVKKTVDTVVTAPENGVAVSGTLSIVPASVVYYEDDFQAITVTGTHETEGTAQKLTQSNDKDGVYGYDAAYAGNLTGHMILHYDFQGIQTDANGAVSDGTSVTDVSGNGQNGTIRNIGDASTQAKIAGDGVLSLPGQYRTVAQGSDYAASETVSEPAYVEIPGTVFTGKEALTVSMRLQSAEYAEGAGRPSSSSNAMYVGNRVSQVNPEKYWLFNPYNIDWALDPNNGYVNSLMTVTGINGETGVIGTKPTDMEWHVYTHVFETGTLTTYCDGEKVNTVNTGISLSDLGNDLEAYIGKSQFNMVDPDERYFRGQISDLRVYDRALTEEEAVQLYSAVNSGTDTAAGTGTPGTTGSLDSAGSCTRLVADSGEARGRMTFTFTGTGFDLVGRSTTDSAGLSILVHDKNNALVKSLILDTYYANGRMYQVPLISVKDLAYGEYHVDVAALKAGSTEQPENVRNILYIDGIRIYNPAGKTTENPQVTGQYQQQEQQAEFLEVRDLLLGKTEEQGVSLAAFEPEQGTTLYQGGSVIIENQEGTGTLPTTSLEDILKYGANNELYLSRGNAVAFHAVLDPAVPDAQRTLQMEVKKAAAEDTKAAQVKVLTDAAQPQTVTVNTCTQMYYAVDMSKCHRYEDGSYLVVLASAGEDILSLTNLKVKGYHLLPLSESDIIQKQAVTDTMRLMSLAFGNDSSEPGGGGEEPETLPYVDVAESDWWYDAAVYNYGAGIMTGIDKTHFAPGETIVRAQFAAVLHKMNESPAVDFRKVFPDVTDDQWFADCVLWAADKKIVTGYTDTNFFMPNNPVTRAELVTMLYRYAGDYKNYDGVTAEGDYSAFPDAASVQKYAQEAVKWAVKNEIITGKTVNGQLILDPLGTATRAECAVMIQRFMKKYTQS